MNTSQLVKIKGNLKEEIMILRIERDHLISKIGGNSKYEFLNEVSKFYEKLIKERKIKIVSINKNETVANLSSDKKNLDNLKYKIYHTILNRGGTVLSCDFIKSKREVDIIKAVKECGYIDLESFIREVPQISIGLNAHKKKIFSIKEENPNINYLVQKEAKIDSEFCETKKMLIEILCEDPEIYHQGKDIIKKFKKKTGKKLSIPGFENIKHFFDHIDEVECSIRGYKIAQGYNIPKKTFNDQNNEYKAKKILKDKNDEITLEEALKKLENFETIEIFIQKYQNKKNQNWTNKIINENLIDSKFIISAIEYTEINIDKIPLIKSFLEDLMISMYKYEYNFSKRDQKKVTDIYNKIQSKLPKDIKLAIISNFRLNQILTKSEFRMILNNIPYDSKLNWLHIEKDKKEIYQKTRMVEKILESSIIVKNFINDFPTEIKNQFVNIFYNKKLKITKITFENESKKSETLNFILKEKMLNDKKIINSSKFICNLFNSSVCIQNKDCLLHHLCAFCCADDHNLTKCIKYNK